MSGIDKSDVKGVNQSSTKYINLDSEKTQGQGVSSTVQGNTTNTNNKKNSALGRWLLNIMKKDNTSEESSPTASTQNQNIGVVQGKAKGTEMQIEILHTLKKSSDIKMKRLLHALDTAKRELLMEIELSQEPGRRLKRRSLFSRKVLGKPKFKTTSTNKNGSKGLKAEKGPQLNNQYQLTNAIIEIKEKHKELDTMNQLITELRQQKHSLIEEKRQLDIIVTKQNEHINSLQLEDEKNKEQISALTAHSSTLLQRLIFEQTHVGALLRANKELQIRSEALNEQIHGLKTKLERTHKCTENHFKESATMTTNLIGDGNCTPKGKLRLDLNGSRVKSVTDKKVYLILEGRRCWVPNIGNLFRSGNVIHKCTQAEIDSIAEGTSLSYNAKLIQVGGDAPVYMFSNGVRRWIWSHSIMEKCNFNWEKIEKISEGEMAKIPLAETIGNSNVL